MMLSSTAYIHLLSWRGLLIGLSLFCIVQILALLGRAIYNIFFHPLSQFPGPKLWIAFPVCKSIAQLRGQLDFQIRDFHHLYGSRVRIGPNELVFTSAAAWKDIYGHGHAELPKHFPSGFKAKAGASNIINSNARDHFRFRRAMLPAFSEKALDQQEFIMVEYVNLLIKRLRDVAKKGQATNMVRWYTYTTFDLIGDLAYGVSFDGLKEGKPNHWVSNIENMMRLFPIILLASASPIVGKMLLFLASDKIKKSQDNHMRMTTELAMSRIKNADKDRRGDFMDFMMRAQGKDHGLSDAELAANSDTLIVAGSETTATLLCGVTFYLLNTPDAYRICVEEVRSAFDSDEEITFKAASAKLPFMLACLDEALRLFPPVPTVLYRQTLPGQVTVIDGVRVPENTSVGVHQMSTFHSESNFHDAKSFHPERWLATEQNDETSPFSNDCRDAFQPFSTGPRNCIGRNLAYHEMRLIMAKVLWNFDLTLTEACRDWAESQKTFALWEKPPLMVEVHERLC